MMKHINLIGCVLLLLGIHLTALASIDVYEFEDESKRVDFVTLTKELRCPKCQNQDIADSNSPIAADMRKEVHRLLNEGKDKNSIVDYMVDRFGEFVTYKPKKTAETFMLWYGPWLLIVVGVIVIVSLIRANKASKDQQETHENTEQASEDIKTILSKYDQKN